MKGVHFVNRIFFHIISINLGIIGSILEGNIKQAETMFLAVLDNFWGMLEASWEKFAILLGAIGSEVVEGIRRKGELDFWIKIMLLTFVTCHSGHRSYPYV